ncbi:MAG: PD-(D/E)XK nuclease family protein, partial [Gemmataceae bacterium]|nr:PD-(D/E)XK nuclease family protein [Gemmataceae bacterium]
MTTIALPVLTPTEARPLRVAPTDVSQFVRLEQCERFLRFRLSERAGLPFMEDYAVSPQRITPLLSLSGKTFEEGVEGDLGSRFESVHYAEKHAGDHNRPANNPDLLAEVARLKAGETVVLFQTRLEATLGAWHVRGDVDLIRLERSGDGRLHALIADLKSTTEARVEHRLQVGFYHQMLDRILADAGLTGTAIHTGILFKPPADPTPEEAVEVIPPLRDAAEKWFGLKDVLLEVVADPDAYLRSASDLVTGPDSTARRVAQAPFADVPFCLSFKCDGCLYNEFCMKDAAERDDLSLLPYTTGVEKEALRRAGVATIQALASLKDFTGPTPGTPGQRADLVPAPGQEAVVRRIAATWPVGPRLDELVHRARSFRRSVKKDGTAALGYIPDTGNSTLPASRPDLNPNLVRVYLDAQHDYLNDRVYLLGALVVGCENGVPDPARRRSVVRMTDGPPETAAAERQVFVDWTRDVVRAVVELAAPGEQKDGKNTAPVHVVFYDRYEQRLLLEGLARNFPPVLKNTPPLYDFLTQFAGFDSPVASFLSDEIRGFKNYPMTCQSLQSVAAYLKFDWNTPHKFRDLFKARVFDYLGKLDADGTSEWYTRRSRFASSVPLENAYAAWGQLPTPKPGRGDEFADFRGATKDVLLAFQARRLEALEHVANAFPGNANAGKTPFVLPDLAGYEDKAGSLAHALAEFVAIERHVTMSDWRGTRHAPPERRVLMGETLLVRYVEADQEPDVAERNREHQRRQRKRAEAEAAHNTQHPGTPFRVPRGQGGEFKWSHDGLPVRLRVEAVGVDCDLHEALALTTFRDGDRLVLFPRLAVDERRPAADRKEFTPTPKQLLYGNRIGLTRIVVTERDDGMVLEGSRSDIVVLKFREHAGSG